MLKKIRQNIRFRVWRWLIYQAGQEVKSGKWQNGEAKLVKSLSIAEDLVKDAGPDTRIGAELCLAQTLTELAGFATHAGDKAKAEEFSRRGSELRTKHASLNTNREIDALLAKGRLLKKEQKLDEAVLLFSEARQLSESKYGSDDPRIIASLELLAATMLSLKNLDESERLRRRVVELREQFSAPKEIDLAMALFNLSLVMRSKKNFDESEQLLVRALGILDSPEPTFGEAFKAVATAKGDLNKIEKLHDRTHGIQHPLGAMVLEALAITNASQGKNTEAESNFRRAIEISEARKPHDLRELGELLKSYAKFLRKAGRVDEAAATEERARKLDR